MSRGPEEKRRRSRWIARALEWNDPRAKYPNLWREGMPSHLLEYDTVACRLRIGDLIAVFSPATPRHPKRSDRYVGISRVIGLRRAHEPSMFWVDLETAHRFREPVDLGTAPRRVFLSADPGWHGPEAEWFRTLLARAVDEGYVVPPEETEEGAPGWAPREEDADEAPPPPPPRRPKAGPPPPAPARVGGPLFAGVDYSGDMRDPKDATWLAVVEQDGDRLRVVRLEATGRHRLEALLRDPDADLSRVEAIGFDFPFGLPVAFAESVLGAPFDEEGWWKLAKRLSTMTRPEYLTAVQEYRDAQGEPKRYTDERAGAFSPLHRVNPDLGPMTFHGVRMIAADRSRYAVRPFERARGRRLLEVYPGAATRSFDLGPDAKGAARLGAILEAAERIDPYPMEFPEGVRTRAAASRDALDAALAARATALAVLSGEADREAEELAPGEAARVRVEGWIYGVPEA
jgi:hypothetical protein